MVRNILAADRTRLANERTFLAYIRTALALVASGLGLHFFFPSRVSQAAGWTLAVLSFSLILWGIRRCRTVSRDIRAALDAERGRGE